MNNYYSKYGVEYLLRKIDFLLSIQRLATVLIIFSIIYLILPVILDKVPDISEYEPIIALVCLTFSVIPLNHPSYILSQKKDFFVFVVICLLLIVPSFQTTLLSLALISGWLYLSANKTKHLTVNYGCKAAAKSIITYVICASIVFFSLKYATKNVLSLDAQMIAWLLQLTTGFGHAQQTIYQGAAHPVLMLKNCSSLPIIMNGIACWLCLSFSLLTVSKLQQFVVCLVLFFALLATNSLRLATMALNMEWHQYWHSDAGMQLFHLSIMVLTLIIIGCGAKWSMR